MSPIDRTLRSAISLLLALTLFGCHPVTPLQAPPSARTVPTPAPPLPTATIVRPTPLVATRPPATVAAPPAATPAASPRPVTPSPVGDEAIPTPPPRDLLELRERLGSRPPGVGTATPVPHEEAVGDQHAFWVADQPGKSYFRTDATLVQISPHARWYVQEGVGVPSAAIQAAAGFFESQTYPTEQRLFGTPSWAPGDGSDPRITILIGRIPGVGGYFSSSDEYPTDVNPFSNQREMIYVNIESARPGTSGFDQTVAHEFMHMIQFHVHRSQDSWIDEGSAELAAQAVTGVTSGAVRSFERVPDTQLNSWADAPAASVPHYGAAYLFLRYVAEQYGGFATIGRIIAEPGRSIAALDPFFRSLAPPTTFDDVFARWVAANYLNDPSQDHGQYGYRGLKVNPTVQRGPTLGQKINGEATQFGTIYYRIQSEQPAVLEFRGATQVKLIGAEPRDSHREWWGNRGDSIDTRLTREVDLRQVTKATLHFSAWYDIEEGYDYAYVVVSSDGGQTWKTLAASDTTTDDPNGQNYGHGFTGTSGGSAPRWTAEVADLSPYAGHQIRLRFEYVTDDAYNADGFAVADITIPEIGWTDDPDAVDGWTAEGFTRIDNRLRQTYLVQALSSTGTPVERMTIGPDGVGSLRIEPDRPIVVAIAGLARLTSQKSAYELTLRPAGP